MRVRHLLAEAAHLPDVLLAVEAVDDDARGEEQQRLEEGVREEVEHREAVGPDPRADEHVADLAHRRVRDHALDVPLDERDDAGDEERHERRGSPPGAARRGAASNTGCVRQMR